MSTSARNAIGSRSASRGGGQPALSLRADSSARSTCARQSACATGSLLIGGDLVGDRGGRPMRLAAAAVEPAQAVDRRSAAAAAAAERPRAAMTTTNRKRPMARAIGGSTSHSPAQENARNRPSAVASVARAGHSRSHNRLPRARLKRPRQQEPGSAVPARCGCSSKPSKSRSVARAQENLSCNRLSRRQFPGHARILCA